jgi:hypothetical protein
MLLFANERNVGKEIRCDKCGRPLLIQHHGSKNPEPSSYLRRNSTTLLLVLAFVGILVLLVMLFLPGEKQTGEQPTAIHRDNDDSIPARLDTLRVTQASGYSLRYCIGEVDPRFDVSTNELRQYVEEAKSVWERSAGKILFTYDPSASFKINLIFDERQEKLLAGRRLTSKINGRDNSSDVLKREYDAEVSLKSQLEREYNSDLEVYDRQLGVHNTMVTYWKNQGGAPPGEYSRLEVERKGLEDKRGRLEEKRASLNEVVARIQSLANRINVAAAQNNADISMYKSNYILPREFEKGQYNGREINIYEYNTKDDLTLALVHEFGHALGFGHVDDPEAIMFYKLEKQDTKNIHLVNADIKLLFDKFHR